MVDFWFFLIYTLVLTAMGFSLPSIYFDPYQKKLIFVLGLVGIWRYGWFFINIIRATIYKRVVFKKIRKIEESHKEEVDPEHIFLLLTTFRIGTDVTIRVYRAVIEEAIRCGYNVTIIASIVEMSEERLIRKIFLEHKPPSRVCLTISRIKGTGKRDGLSVGFRVVANASDINLEKSVVAVIDGDSILGEDLIRKCARLFGINDNLGALTTDEDAILAGDDFPHNIYRQWYKLRFAQRNISMSSMALSNRVLTLTGRMSMIRANIVATRDFIETVQDDHINHPILGKFKFLTGDDKSSWFDVVKEGWDMLYIPDVVVYTVEEIPDRNYFKGSITLMHRWFGNQYRTNTRALKLSPKTFNWYPWYGLIDQRVTMWTAPYGLFIALFGSLNWGIEIFYAYIWWVLFSRLLMTYAYRLSREEILPSWPFFLYYNQIVGSFVKIYIWNHLYKQSWTRQKTKLKTEDRFVQWYRKTAGDALTIVKFLFFIIVINILVQNITFDEIWSFFNIII